MAFAASGEPQMNVERLHSGSMRGFGALRIAAAEWQQVKMALSTVEHLACSRNSPQRPINQIQIRQMNTALIYDPMVNFLID